MRHRAIRLIGVKIDPAGRFADLYHRNTAANDDIARLHDRMPVILEPNAWPVWLGEEAGDYAALLRPAPAPAGTVRLWPVSRAVNNVRNNGPELLEPMADPGPETAKEAALDVNPA